MTALALERRSSIGNSEHLCQLGSALEKTVGILGNEGYKFRGSDEA